jgi:hypothetical protein
MATTRIATVKATGRRYVVERIAFARKPWEADKVFCWGDVESYFRKGGAARAVHEKDGKSFARADVDIAEVEVTDALYRGLLAQSAEVRREAGHVVEQRGRNYVDRGTPEQAEAPGGRPPPPPPPRRISARRSRVTRTSGGSRPSRGAGLEP